MNSKPSEMLQRMADKTSTEFSATMDQAEAAVRNDPELARSLLAAGRALDAMSKILRASASEERAKEAALEAREQSAP